MIPGMTGKCPICGGSEFEPGFQGRMTNGMGPQCKGCKSAERHRIIRLMYSQLVPMLKDWRVLQFAPDGMLDPKWFKEYHYSKFGGHNSLDMTAIALPDASYDLVVSNHVIEHVSDDRAAIRESLRVVGEKGVVHVNAPSPAFRYATVDWGFPDPARNEHYREYGADMGRRLARAAPEAHCVGVVGLDPVTFTVDVVFFLSRSERALIDLTRPLLRGGFGCVVVQ